MTITGLTYIPTKAQVHPMRSPERVAAILKAVAEEMGKHDGSQAGTVCARLAALEADTTGLQLASTTPAGLGTAAVGVGTTAARADHVHTADVGLTTLALTSGDWATSVPTTLTLALNRISALLKTLNTNTAIP